MEDSALAAAAAQLQVRVAGLLGRRGVAALRWGPGPVAPERSYRAETRASRASLPAGRTARWGRAPLPSLDLGHFEPIALRSVNGSRQPRFLDGVRLELELGIPLRLSRELLSMA